MSRVSPPRPPQPPNTSSFVDIAHTYSFFTIFDIEELISSPNGLNLFGGAAAGAESFV